MDRFDHTIIHPGNQRARDNAPLIGDTNEQGKVFAGGRAFRNRLFDSMTPSLFGVGAMLLPRREGVLPYAPTLGFYPEAYLGAASENFPMRQGTRYQESTMGILQRGPAPSV